MALAGAGFFDVGSCCYFPRNTVKRRPERPQKYDRPHAFQRYSFGRHAALKDLVGLTMPAMPRTGGVNVQSIAEPKYESAEPWDIRSIRTCLQHWPFGRGKGILLRLASPLLRNRAFTFEVEPGVVIPARFDDYMIRYYFANAFASEPAVKLSRRLIQPGDTVFDVGANIGLWAMGAAVRAESGGAVHAFEPVPENIARLQEHLRLNGLTWIHCEPLAVADRCGVTCFYNSATDNSGLGSLGQRSGSERSFEIACITLDGYCSQQGITRVDLIKVDVEGGEELVFRGAEQLLGGSHAPAIMFEASEELARRMSSSSIVVKKLLAAHGYAIYRYQRDRLCQVAVEEPHAFDDLFAFKPYHFDRQSNLRELLQRGA